MHVSHMTAARGPAVWCYFSALLLEPPIKRTCSSLTGGLLVIRAWMHFHCHASCFHHHHIYQEGDLAGPGIAVLAHAGEEQSQN